MVSTSVSRLKRRRPVVISQSDAPRESTPEPKAAPAPEPATAAAPESKERHPVAAVLALAASFGFLVLLALIFHQC